jgi:hypothetical protein
LYERAGGSGCLLFFSEAVAEINAANPELLGRVDDPEGAQGTAEESDETAKGGLGYATLAMIGSVVEFTRLNIYEVYRMQALEFFAYVSFLIARNKKKEEEIRKIRRS